MQYFGTDGIRAKADWLLSRGLAEKLGEALAERGKKILVGRDVRLSSPALEKALIKGLLDNGAEVLVTGIIPTPALAYTAKTECADYAVMITASHNAPDYNGLKVFGSGGQKLSLSEELALDDAVAARANCGGENRYDTSSDEARNDAFNAFDSESASGRTENYGLADFKAASVKPSAGKVRIVEGADFLYAKHIRRMFPRFDGIKVRLDCANGCFAQLADKIFSSLGASVVAENNERDGNKVNVCCGSTNIKNFLPHVKREEIGFAFDGDGDRVIAVVDGKVYDGDAILLALSSLYRIQGKLRGKYVVGTLLTNTRLQRELAYQGTSLLRANVGDKYVLDALIENDCLLGGEKSGHIIMLDKCETGDGMITALSLLNVKKTIGSLPKFCPYPMYEFNIPSKEPASRAESAEFKRKIRTATAVVGAKGRLVVRPSGTEPYIRVAAEFFSDNCDDLLDSVKRIFELPSAPDGQKTENILNSKISEKKDSDLTAADIN